MSGRRPKWMDAASDEENEYDVGGGKKKSGKGKKGGKQSNRSGGSSKSRHVQLAMQAHASQDAGFVVPASLLEAFAHLQPCQIQQMYEACRGDEIATVDLLLNMTSEDTEATTSGGAGNNVSAGTAASSEQQFFYSTFREPPACLLEDNSVPLSVGKGKEKEQGGVSAAGLWGWPCLPEVCKEVIMVHLNMTLLAAIAPVCREFKQRSSWQLHRVTSFTAPARMTLHQLTCLLPRLPALNTLSLCKARGILKEAEDFFRVFAALSRGPQRQGHTLRSLDLSRLPVTDECVLELRRSQRGLTEVNLEDCGLLTAGALLALVNTSQHIGQAGGGKAETVSGLKLAGCDAVCNATLQKLLSAGVTVLDVSRTPVSRVTQLPLKMQSIRLAQCNQLQDLVLQLESRKSINQLQKMDLNRCTRLGRLVLGAPQLKELNLHGCCSLTSLTLRTPHLTHLTLSQCKALSEVPEFVTPNLRSLNLMGHTGLHTADLQMFLRNAPKLETLNLDNCTALREIQIEGECGLVKVSMCGCSSLTEAHFRGAAALHTLTACANTAMTELRVDSPALRQLDLSNCKALHRLLLTGRHRISAVWNGCDSLPELVQRELASRSK